MWPLQVYPTPQSIHSRALWFLIYLKSPTGTYVPPKKNFLLMEVGVATSGLLNPTKIFDQVYTILLYAKTHTGTYVPVWFPIFLMK